MKGLDLGLLLSKVVSIDGVKLGITSGIGIKHELGSNPVINLEVVADSESIENLMEYLYMADIMTGKK